ncbi:MAG: phosphopyruvate hydratase [Candidatus Kerfeldbacteria bacterium]|nr:phosphopyruvate hydratase [Candidatus Kerfeldbacteria bacterium]
MPKNTIKDVAAREILDSRGEPTVEVTLTTSSGVTATASVPAGASTGVHEAYELRDGDKKRYDGKGVLKAVANVIGEIRQGVVGRDVEDQPGLDTALRELDGTSNKHRLGANAILGVSLATAQTAAKATGLPLYRYLQEKFNLPKISPHLPQPLMNILNGGRHANSGLDVQEFMIVPHVATNNDASPVAAWVRVGSEVFHALGRVLKKKNMDTDVGNEGGYAPQLKSNSEALDLLIKAITEAGYKPGTDVSLALDVAASEFFRHGHYQFEGKEYSSGDMVKVYQSWLKDYPLISIEDGLAQDDWRGWQELTQSLGQKLMLVGDDLFVTNEDRLKLGFEFGAANAILIKPNQIGTLSETISAVRLAQSHGYKVVVSHRSGETMDTTIADLAVAVGAPYLKAGAPSRGERVAKYNRLMDIAQELAK